MAVKRQTLLLGVAGVLGIVAIIVWSSGGSVSTAPATVARRAPAPQQAPGGEGAQAPDKVNLEALKGGRNEPVDSSRNPFRFRPPPAPPPPPPAPPRPPITPGMPGNGGPLGPGGAAVPSGPPPPPTIPLKFIGIVTQGSTRLAVLSDGKGTPQSGKEGQTILGQYVILKIGNESIEMAYVDGRGRQTIRLTGQ